jgi:hypothetical protein
MYSQSPSNRNYYKPLFVRVFTVNELEMINDSAIGCNC